MNLIGLILIFSGILYIILGSWEANIINSKLNTFDDSSNNIVSSFIIIKVLFNIIWGCYCILLSLFFICKKNDMHEDKLYLNQNSYGCVNFIIGIFGLIEYYYNNSNVIHQFKKVLFIEMIIFYIIYGTIFLILLLYCSMLFIFVYSTINIIENTNIELTNMDSTNIESNNMNSTNIESNNMDLTNMDLTNIKSNNMDLINIKPFQLV